MILVMTCYSVFGQLIPINDPSFNTYLCNNFSLAMNGDCSLLDTVKATSEYTGLIKIHLSNKGITNADELIYFTEVDTIYLNQNKLISFPTDLSSFRSLGRLNIAFNRLTVAPDIHYTNSISGDTAVKLVYLQQNRISSLPPSWYAPNPYTQVIDIDNNDLTSVPDFVNYPQIKRLDLKENRLAFEDLIPIMSHPSWASEEFTFFPQKEFEVDIDTLVKVGDKIVVDISTGLSSNEYFILKNGRGIDDNRTGVFEIEINSEDDLGEYWFKVKNDSFPDPSNFLASLKYNVALDINEISQEDKIKEGDVYVFSPNGDGVADSFLIEGEGEVQILNKNGQQLRAEQLPFNWLGDDDSGVLSPPGLHIIKINENEFLKVLITY